MPAPATTATKPAAPVARPPSPAPQSAPRPAAPAPPNPSGAPKPARRSINDDLDEAFAVPTPAPAKAPDAPKAAVTPPAAPDASTAPPDEPAVAPDVGDEYSEAPTKPVEAQKPATTAPAAPDTGPAKAPELRAAYAKVKSRVAELEKQLNEVKAKPIEDTERKTFTDQILDLNKKLEEAAGKLKSVAWEQSDDYRKQFEQPFIDAWQDGVSQTTTLTVTNPDGSTRKGTSDDFQAIMAEPDNGRAAATANEMFGPNAFYVLSQRRELQKLNNTRNKALTEYRATVNERVKAEQEAGTKAQKESEERKVQWLTKFKALNDEAVTKYPDWFAPLEGDEEGNKLLEKVFRDTDAAFNGNGLTPEQTLRLHSATRNKAAAFGRLVHRVKQRDSRIAELEKELAEIRASTPGDGKVNAETGEGGAPKRLTFEQELEVEMNRKR